MKKGYSTWHLFKRDTGFRFAYSGRDCLSAFLVLVTLIIASCSDGVKENIDANLLEIELEGQIGIAEADVANAEFECMLFTDNYASVKVKRMIISENATSSVEVGESLNLSNQDNSASITITSETGVEKVYTIKAIKFEAPEFTGQWTFTNECYFYYTYCNDDGTGCGQEYYASLSEDDYGTYFIHGDKIYDNTLNIEFSTVDGSGNLLGSYSYGQGSDGNIGSYEIVTEAGQTLDLNTNFSRLFQGNCTWKMNPATNEIIFYNADKSKQSPTYSNNSDMVHWQVSTLDESSVQLTIWLKVDRAGLPSDHEAWQIYGYNATAWTLGGYMVGLVMIKD